MAMASDRPATNWRGFAMWSVMGAIACTAAMVIAAAMSPRGFDGALFHPDAALTLKLGLVVVAASMLVGFTMRHRAFTPRKIAGFLISNVVALAFMLLALLGVGTPAGRAMLNAMGASEKAAAGTGALYVLLGLMTLAVRAAARFQDAETAEDLRTQSRMLGLAAVVMVAWGAAMIVLALGGPGGIVDPGTALTAIVALMAVSLPVSFGQWRRMDELNRSLAREAGNWTLYLLMAIGGGWAVLAHLGFTPAPAPIDWLSMMEGLLLVASFIASWRRGLLTPR